MKKEYLKFYSNLYDYIDKSEWLKQKFCELSSFYTENNSVKVNEYDLKIDEIDSDIQNKHFKFKQQVEIMIEKGIIEDKEMSYKASFLSRFIEFFVLNPSYRENFFSFFQYNKVKLYTKDIEFLRGFVEENKLSNSLIKLESPAENTYTVLKSQKQKLKWERNKAKLKSEAMDWFLLFKVNDEKIERLIDKTTEARLKVIDINNELSTETTLKERNDYFKDMTYEKAKIIVDSYDIINSCVEDCSNLIKNKDELIEKRDCVYNELKISSINDCFKTKSDIERIKLEFAKYRLINYVTPKDKIDSTLENKVQYEFLTSLVDSFIENYADDINEILICLVNQIKAEDISSIVNECYKKR